MGERVRSEWLENARRDTAPGRCFVCDLPLVAPRKSYCGAECSREAHLLIWRDYVRFQRGTSPDNPRIRHSPDEWRELRAEAVRRVRRGEVGSAVARELGVDPHTLYAWTHRARRQEARRVS